MLKIKKLPLNKPIPISRLIPNMLTLLGLVTGIGSIRYGLEAKWEQAVYCIFVACIIDGLDGKVARLLNATSIFGAELDSLCDFVNFGFCPAILIYLWSYQQYEYKLISWSVILLYIICLAIRLARFNTLTFSTTQNKTNDFLVGVPAPSSAMLVLLPMMINFDIMKNFSFDIRSHTIIIDIYIVIIGILAASKFPTFSLKSIHIKPEYLSICMIIAAIIMIMSLVYPWYFLPILALIYLVSIPLCFKISKQFQI